MQREVRIPIHSRKYPGLFVLIDPEDAGLLSPFHWNPMRSTVKSQVKFYAHAWMGPRNSRKRVSLHRFLLDLSKEDPDVDHIDGNGLNNHRSNLRLCTDSQNQANRHNPTMPDSSSTFRGVTWHKQCEKWQAGIKVEGKSYHLGLFTSEIDAGVAYNNAAIEQFGAFATLNDFENEVAA